MKPSELIRKHGWTRGQPEDKQGRICLVAAIDLAYPDVASWESVRSKLLSHLKLKSYRSLVAWNDAQKSRRAVIKALEAIGE